MTKRKLLSLSMVAVLIINIVAMIPAASAVADPQLQFTTSISKTKIKPGDIAEVSVKIDNYASITNLIEALQIEVSVDPAKLEIVRLDPVAQNVVSKPREYATFNGADSVSAKLSTIGGAYKAVLLYGKSAEFSDLGLAKSNSVVLKFNVKALATIDADTTATVSTAIIACAYTVWSPDFSQSTITTIPTASVADKTVNIFVPATKTALNAAITAAESKVATAYTKSSYDAMKAVLDSAKAMAADDNATQQEVDAKTTALTNATTALDPRDTTALAATITAAKAKSADDYTTASFAALTAKITAAETTLNNLNSNQAAVDTAKTELQTAIEGLVEKSPTGIEVSTKPSINYLVDEDLDVTGGKITVTYDNGTTMVVDMTDEDVTVTDFDSETAGTQTLTVTYMGMETTYDVTVKSTDDAKKEIKEELTDKIPAVANIKLTDADSIKALKSYYDALSLSLKALVPDETVKALNAAVAKIAELEEAAAKPPVTTTPTTPTKTGDYTSIAIILATLVLAGGALVVFKKRKFVK